MKTFFVTVEETRVHYVTYQVDAESIEEARSHDHCYQHGEEVDDEFQETTDVQVIKVEEAE